VIRAKTPASPEPLFYFPMKIVFSLCLLSHILAAAYAPIQDCDETFNYWEPLHYLNHGYGLQTWEYSPEFSIRSWAYIVIHAIPAKIAGLLSRSKTFEFYFLRMLLAILCAAAETRLIAAISRNLNTRIGVFYLIIIVSSPGIFYASVAFLPSSFAMYTSALGLASFVDLRGGSKTATGIMWFGIGALVGWPFSGVLIAPFVIGDCIMAVVTRDAMESFGRYLDGTVRCLIVLALQVSIDAFFYHMPVVVPWRLVFYNIFSGKDRGPNIFGTEPWDFYARNLLLNFNIWFLLAVSAGPMLMLQNIFHNQLTTNQTFLRLSILITPFYLWFGIFTLQPHKEERFMYPAYPFLVLNAAIGLHFILTWIGTSDPRKLMGKIPTQVKVAVVLTAVAGAVNVGLLRIFGTVSAYRAPLQIYQGLEAAQGDIVCFGKDWYRFPTSQFLPNGIHAKFIRSEFDGLLPGEFSEAGVGFGFFPGTWLIPPGMNDRNKEDSGKYIDISHCSYLVDSNMPNAKSTVVEPNYAASKDWEKVSCERFLDTVETSMLGRTVWIPDLPFIPVKYRRVWGEHCLLKRRNAPPETLSPME
jgi:alpha-1,2-mannosyltransferase